MGCAIWNVVFAISIKRKQRKNIKTRNQHDIYTLDQINSSDPDFKYVTFSQFNEPLLDSRIFDFIEHAKKILTSLFYLKWIIIR